MSVKDSVRNIFKRFERRHELAFTKWRKRETTVAEWKNLFDRKDEWKKDLTDEQKEKVDTFFKTHYGKKIPYYWHRMYTNYTGQFDEKYFPEIIFSTTLEERLNPFQIAFPLQNKSFCPQRLFGNLESEGVYVPTMIFENCNGICWTDDGRCVGSSDACKMLVDSGEVVIKPTIDTMGARGVRLCNFKNGIDIKSNKTVDEILQEYQSNFIVQRKVINHESINRLYSNSVNTLRVITFITEDGIHLAPLSMRIGIGGRFVDNGGIFIGVNLDGTLYPEGFSKKHIKRYKKHPDTGIVFEGYRIEGVKEITNACMKLHSMLPQLKMLSWDMAYDENGNIVIIEVNTTAQSVWFPQMVTGKSIFGEYTAEMLRLAR